MRGVRCFFTTPFLSPDSPPLLREDDDMSVKIESPCMDCPDRHEGCHGKCEDYKAYKAAKEKARENERKSKDVFKDYCIVRARRYGR